MGVLPVVVWPDPRLSTVCEAVENPASVAGLAADMLETMYAAPGRGLAAPQVGVLQRLFVMDVAWKTGAPDPQVFVNPRVLWRSDEVVSGGEGCLSIPGLTVEVGRAAVIVLEWQGLDSARAEARLEGFAAICAQHEIDHLDGIVTLDRVAPDVRAAALAGYAP
jgi:peptide deformylase